MTTKLINCPNILQVSSIYLDYSKFWKYIKNYYDFFVQGELVSDPESSLKGTKPQDHRILCNLVNLYKDLMKCLDPNALTKWLPQLIPSLLKRSTSFPLVSAFYKLLAATLQVADSTNYFQVVLVKSWYIYVYKFNDSEVSLLVK